MDVGEILQAGSGIVQAVQGAVQSFIAAPLDYGRAAWETARYFADPRAAALAGGVVFGILLVRVYIGGVAGALIRLAVYGGLIFLIATSPGFVAVFADQPDAAPIIAVLLVVIPWLPLTVLGGLIRRSRRQGGPTPYAAAAPAGAVGREAFDVRRTEKENKQIVVIMMTDIKGYSARMEKDETATYALLKEHNIIMRKAITTNRGREIKTIGDAFMVVFMAPIDALRCAIAMQKGLYAFNKPRPSHDRLEVRIGLYQGEAVVTEKDVFGEAVNIAARMESITDPGGISVSAEIYEAVKGKVDVGFQSVGIPKMKNIAKPPEVFRVHVNHV